MIKKQFMFLLILYFCHCCSFPSRMKDVATYSYHPNGEILYKILRSDSSMYRLEYDSIGQLIDSIPYKILESIPIVNGVRKTANYSKGFTQYTTYENGLRTGVTWSDYFNDSLYYYGYLENGEQDNQWYFFDSLGRMIDYKVYNDGELVYYRRYNSNGMYKKEGDGIITVDFIRSERTSNQTEYIVTVADPLQTDVKVEYMCTQDTLKLIYEKTGECQRIKGENRFKCLVCDPSNFLSVQIKWTCVDSMNNLLENQIYNLK